MDDPFAFDSLIDGRYQVINQHGYDGLAFHYSVLDIYAKSTKLYHLVWYLLDDAALIEQFEAYRRCLRQLEREGWAALERIVARPASYYAVWAFPQRPNRATGRQAPQRPIPEALQARLETYGYHTQAHWYALDTSYKRKLFGLAFAHSQAKLPSPANTLRKRYRPFVQSWLPALLLSSLAAYLFLVALAVYTERPIHRVPDIRGMAIADALERIHQAGFQAMDNPIAVLDAPLGQAQSTSPAAGSLLRYGATVKVHYALPAQALRQQTVPDLQGLHSKIAGNVEKVLEQRLAQRKLYLGTVISVTSPLAATTVLAQSPPADSVVVEGSHVDVIVSRGNRPRQSVMPDVRGLPLAEASAWARLAGIRKEIVTETRLDSSVPPATVLQQNILPERIFVPEHVTLRLVISEGGREKSLQGVPDFTGMSLSQARALAERKSINLSITPLSQADAPAGVILQTPPPQAAIRTLLAGVNLWVNTPPAPAILQNPSNLNAPILTTPTTPDSTSGNPVISTPVNPNADIYLYTWSIQGISASNVLADVTVTIPDGQRYVIDRQRVNNGDILSGSWQAPYGVPLRFELSIDGVAYGQAVMINPR